MPNPPSADPAKRPAIGSNAAPYEYAVIRVVPHEERGEFINAGIVLYSPAHRFLDARIALSPARLAALAPDADVDLVRRHLEAILKICAGGPDAAGLGELTTAERFRWLTSPRSTIIQTSAVHTGLTDDPRKTLDHLIEMMVPH